MAIKRRGQAQRGGEKQNRRDREVGIYLDPGPYVAVVINNVDNKRMGFITVHIPDLSANYDETFEVRFASPFMSHSQAEGKTGGYDSVKQTAGMWFPQPDIGTEVVVMFPSGQANKGIWIACLSERFNNHTLPGFASTEFWDADTDKNKEFQDPKTKKYNKLQATGEFYDPIKPGTVSYHEDVINPVVKKKPINNFLNNVYKKQGLINDDIRGHTTSSAQRETPSNVFGFSTKGRSTSDIKDNPSVAKKLKEGRVNDLTAAELKTLKFVTRKQGHSFVMDDGDLEGNNELMRLRSSSGHQVLLHDSEGVMYVGNSSGSVWLEFNNDGTLDLYSQDSINVRSKNMNFYADQNMNFHAKQNVSILAGSKFQVDAGNLNLKTTSGGIQIDSKNVVDIKASGAINLDASGNANIKAGSEVKIDGSCVELGNGADGVSGTPSKLPTSQKPDTMQIGNGFWGSTDKAIQTIATRVPTHEPFAARGDKATSQVSSTSRAVDDLTIAQSLQDEPEAQEGPKQARNYPLEREDLVTRGSVINQPEPNGAVGDLTPEQTKALLAAIGQRESSNNYKAVNQFGYLGKYQMGIEALEDAGYIKPGISAQAKDNGYTFRNINNVLQDPNVWTGKGGVAGKAEFLNSVEAQEAAMETYTDRNVRTLKRIGVITSSTTQEEQGGLIMAAHLKGPGDVKKWYTKGGTFTDGNNVSIDTYYNIGRSAIV